MMMMIMMTKQQIYKVKLYTVSNAGPIESSSLQYLHAVFTELRVESCTSEGNN